MIDPGESHHEHHKTGVNWVDLTIAMTALLISVTSLILSVVDGRTLERMADANAKLVQENSWPFVSYRTGHDNDGTVHVGLINKGVGPAKIETIELKWKGVAYGNAFDFLAACCGYRRDPRHEDYDLGTVDVLRAGQEGNLFALNPAPYNQAVRDRFDAARISPNMNLDVCYCSVFDECWKTDVVKITLRRDQVERCEPVNNLGIAK